MRATINRNQYAIFEKSMLNKSISLPNEVNSLLEKLDIEVSELSSTYSLSDYQVHWIAYFYLNGYLENFFDPQQFATIFETYLNALNFKSDLARKPDYHEEVLKLQLQGLLLVNRTRGKFEYQFNLKKHISPTNFPDTLLLPPLNELPMFPRGNSLYDSEWFSLPTTEFQAPELPASSISIATPPPSSESKTSAAASTRPNRPRRSHKRRQPEAKPSIVLSSRPQFVPSIALAVPEFAPAPMTIIPHEPTQTVDFIFRQLQQRTNELNQAKIDETQISEKNKELEEQLTAKQKILAAREEELKIALAALDKIQKEVNEKKSQPLFDDYQKFKDEILTLTKNQFVTQFQNQQSTLTLSMDKAKLKEEIETLESTQTELVDEKVELVKEISRLTHLHKRSEIKLEKLESSSNEQLQELIEQIAELNKRIKKYKRTQTTLEEKHDELIAQQQSHAKEIKELEAQYNSMAKQYTAAAEDKDTQLKGVKAREQSLLQALDELKALHQTTSDTDISTVRQQMENQRKELQF